MTRHRLSVVLAVLLLTTHPHAAEASSPRPTDFGPVASGFIRVMPANAAPGSATSWEEQPVPLVTPGLDRAGAPAQMLIGSHFSVGDSIVLRVRADGANGDGQQSNCTQRSASVGFSERATRPVVVRGPWSGVQSWGGDDPGDGPGTDMRSNNPDLRAPVTQTLVPPVFAITRSSSSDCRALGVLDQVELQFLSTSTHVGGPQWEITLTDLAFDIGDQVNAGPLHVIPFAVSPRPGLLIGDPMFGGNRIDDAGTALMWTDVAVISPVEVSMASPSVPSDGASYALPPVRVTEIAPDALEPGRLDLMIDGVSRLGGTPTFVVTGDSGTIVTDPVFSANGLSVLVTGNSPGLRLALTVSGLRGESDPSGAGRIGARLPTPQGTWRRYMLPDDQLQGGSTRFSDVDIPPDPSSVITASAPDQRLGGADRYATAAAIAKADAPCTEWAVVVSGQAFADALSANFLAGQLSARFGRTVPVLSTATGALSTAARAAMSTAGVKHAIVVGGPAAVADSVLGEIDALPAAACATSSLSGAPGSSVPAPGQTLDVTRVAGVDRFATNRAVIAAGGQWLDVDRSFRGLEFSAAPMKTAVVATGRDFPDALAAGPIVFDGLPLVLTDTTALPDASMEMLRGGDIRQVVIVGGPAAVSEAVVGQLERSGIQVERVSGGDRYTTAVAVASFMERAAPLEPVPGRFDGGLRWGPYPGVVLTAGTTFADALTGASLAWSWRIPVLLTARDSLPPATVDWLRLHRPAVHWVSTLGLTGAVSDAAVRDAVQSIG